MGRQKKAITGMTRSCGLPAARWQPLEDAAKTTSSAMATTKLENTVSATAKVVVT